MRLFSLTRKEELRLAQIINNPGPLPADFTPRSLQLKQPPGTKKPHATLRARPRVKV